jgi:hypothetical protein
MTAVSVFEGQSVLVKIGDGASPEVFAHDCMINLTRGFTIDANMIEEEVFDCDAPDAPAVIYRLKRSVSISVTGTGKCHKTSLSTWLAYAKSASAKNVKIEIAGTGGQRITLAMHCGSFGIEGEPKNYATANVSLASHGDWTTETIT